VGVIYLDNNATTPCADEVIEAMIPFMREEYGNAGSAHVLGRRSAAAVAEAREQVAGLMGCADSDIVFTSGATESCNMVLLGLDRLRGKQRHIAVSTIEHKAVLEPCRWLEENGVPVTYIPVTHDGIVCLDKLRETLCSATTIVAVQAANNETGAIQPTETVTDMAHASGALVLCDAAQALGKMPFNVRELGIDYAAASAHKAYGPKGVGALYIRDAAVRRRLQPIYYGGGQEGGLRPGTLNVPAIVGFGEACRLAAASQQKDIKAVSILRDLLESELLSQIDGAKVNGANVQRLPGTTSITVPGIVADALLANVPGVCFSNGSACTSGAAGPSHVLTAMGLTRTDAGCTIRLSVGRQNTLDEVQHAARAIAHGVRRLARELE
jgi:cysteine desulfurase